MVAKACYRWASHAGQASIKEQNMSFRNRADRVLKPWKATVLGLGTEITLGQIGSFTLAKATGLGSWGRK